MPTKNDEVGQDCLRIPESFLNEAIKEVCKMHWVKTLVTARRLACVIAAIVNLNGTLEK